MPLIPSQLLESLDKYQAFVVILLYFLYKLIINLRDNSFNKKAEKRRKVKYNLQIYNGLLKEAFGHIKDMMRYVCRKNGFDKLEGAVWKAMVSKLTKELFAHSIGVFDEQYDNDIMMIPFNSSNSSVSDDDLYLATLNMMDELKDISVKAKEKIEKLDGEFQEKVNLHQSDSGLMHTMHMVREYIDKSNVIKISIMQDQMEAVENSLECTMRDIYSSFKDRIQEKAGLVDKVVTKR